MDQYKVEYGCTLFKEKTLNRNINLKRLSIVNQEPDDYGGKHL